MGGEGMITYEQEEKGYQDAIKEITQIFDDYSDLRGLHLISLIKEGWNRRHCEECEKNHQDVINQFGDYSEYEK